MKTPFDTIRGKIVEMDERTGDMTIVARYDDWPTLCKREYKECYIELIDSRTLSDKQRRTCYALIAAIADYSGNSKDEIKELTKLNFVLQEAEKGAERLFSLSNAPVSLVAAYERFLVHFVLDNDIPTKFSLLDFVDDVPDYVYACLIHKKCAICGKPAELHHQDRVGMGRDRSQINHIGMRAQPLCRVHHREVDDIGQISFNEKYHLCDGIPIDRTIARIYRLKIAKEAKEC